MTLLFLCVAIHVCSKAQFLLQSSPSKESNKNDEEFSYEKFAYEAANKRDDQLISSLGKKLGFKKSTKKLPNVFEQDGLDCIFLKSIHYLMLLKIFILTLNCKY